MSEGYIYIASNNVSQNPIDYVAEAAFSAISLKKVDPNAHITLFTDKPFDSDAFDSVVLEPMSLRCKMSIFNKSPYEKTLYIDTDTYINCPVNDVFELLDNYELLAVHDYARKRILPIPEYMAIPYGFSELNGGIIGFRRCANFEKMMELWNHYFEKYQADMPWDQPSFRVAVWESKINLYVLPSEYNRRGSHHTKQKKRDKLKKAKDPRYGDDHLKTRIFHFHGLTGKKVKKIERMAQDL